MCHTCDVYIGTVVILPRKIIYEAAWAQTNILVFVDGTGDDDDDVVVVVVIWHIQTAVNNSVKYDPHV